MSPVGQITPDSPFGQWLQRLAGHPGVQTILDIGTWNGMGSTKCLVQGIGRRHDSSQCVVLSVEANPIMYRVALENWASLDCSGNSPLAIGSKQLRITKGRIAKTMMAADEVLSHPLYPEVAEHYRLWYEQDVKDFSEAPLLRLPPRIDLAVLDGGEFADDWTEVAARRPLFIALDDTKVMKNYKAVRALESDPAYRRLAAGEDRNGWAIYERREVPIDGWGC